MSTPLNVYFGEIYLEHFSKIQELRDELKANRPKPKKYKKPSENILALKKSNIQNFCAFRPISPGERRRNTAPMLGSKMRLEKLAKDLEFQHQSKCLSPTRPDCNDSTFSLDDFQTPKKKVTSKSFVEEMIPSLDVSRISQDPNTSFVLNSSVDFMDSSGVLKIEANEKTQMFIIDLSRTTQGFVACSAREFQTLSVRQITSSALFKPKIAPVYQKQVHYFKIPSLDLSFGAASKPDLRQCRNHLGDSVLEFDATISSLSKTPNELADTLHYAPASQPYIIKSILIEANIVPKTPDSSPSEVEFDSSVEMVESLRGSLDRRFNKSYSFVMDLNEYKQLEIITSEDSDICTSRFRNDCKENDELAAMQPQFPVYSVSRELEYLPGEYIQQQSDPSISPTLEINLGFGRPFSTFNPIEISAPVLIADSFCAEGFGSCKSGSSLQTEYTPPPSSSESIEKLDSFPDFHFDSGSPLITELEAADENARPKKLQAEGLQELKSCVSSPEERLLTMTDNLLSHDEELSPTFTYNYSDGSETVANETHPTCTLRNNYTEREAFSRQYDCLASETHREVETEPDLATDSIVVYDYFSINPRPVEHDFSSSCSNLGKDDIIVIDERFIPEMSSPEEVKRYIEDVMDEVLRSSDFQKGRNSCQEVYLDEVEEEYTQEDWEIEREMQFGEVIGRGNKEFEKGSDARVSYSVSDDGKISYKNSEEDRISYKFSEEDLISDKFDKYESMLYRTSDERISNKTEEEEGMHDKATEYEEEISKMSYQQVYEDAQICIYKHSPDDRFCIHYFDYDGSTPMNKESDKSSEDEIYTKLSDSDCDTGRYKYQRFSDKSDYNNLSRGSEKASFREERTSEKGVQIEENSYNPLSSNNIPHLSSTPKQMRLNITPNVSSVDIFSKEISFTRMDSFTSEEILPVTQVRSYGQDAETYLEIDPQESELYKNKHSKTDICEIEIDHEVLPRYSSPVKIHPALVDLDLLEFKGNYERYQPKEVEVSNIHETFKLKKIDLLQSYDRYHTDVMEIKENNQVTHGQLLDFDLLEIEQSRDLPKPHNMDLIESSESLYRSQALKPELIQIQDPYEISESCRSSINSTAINIQPVMRGYLSRNSFHYNENQRQQALLQSNSAIRGYFSRKSFIYNENQREQALLQSHSAIRGYLSRKSFHYAQHQQEEFILSKLSEISHRLQTSTAKKCILKAAQHYLQSKHLQSTSCIVIQKHYRGYSSRKQFRPLICQRLSAKVKILAMVSGWKVRRIVDSYAFLSQRQKIQDMYAILQLSLSKADSPEDLIRSIYSELPILRQKYMNEIEYYYSHGSWIHLKLKTKRSQKATPEPRLMENKDEIEDVDMNGSGYFSVKQDHELGDISSQNILDAVNRTMSFEPPNSETYSSQPDISKLSFDSFYVNPKQSKVSKKPQGLTLNLEEIMRNQREAVSYHKPIQKQPIKKLSHAVPQKHVPRHAYIKLPLISSESEESFRDTTVPFNQEIEKQLFSESSFSIANLSSVASDPTIPYLTFKSTIKSPLSILHNPTFTPKPEPKFLKLKSQPKQNQRLKVASIDIRNLLQNTDLYTPSIASIKAIESLSVSELEMIFRDLRRNHVTSEEYFLQSSRVVPKSAIPQYRLNSLFFKDRF